MATKYDNFLAPVSDRGEFGYVPGATIPYPTADQVNVFGPLYLPRVYGKDLTSFEIASSGSVAVSLNDTFSFELSRDSATSNIFLTTQSNDSFQINVGQGNMLMTMDTTSNHASFFSSNDVTVEALDVLTLKGNEVILEIGESFGLNAKNIYITGDSNVDITAATGSLSLSADDSNLAFTLSNSNAYLTATSNIVMTAGDSYLLTVNSNMSLIMDATTDDVSLTTDGRFVVNTVGDVDITSSTSSVLLRAANSDVRVELDSSTSNLSLYSVSNIFIQADNELAMISASTISATTGDKFLVSASNDATIASNSNVTISALEQLTMTSQDNVLLSTANAMTVTASNSMAFTSSNAYSVSAASNVSLESVSASLNLSAAGGQVFSSYDAPTQSLTTRAAGSITVSASNDIYTSASNDYTVVASNDVSLTAAAQSMTLSAFNDSMRIIMDHTTATLKTVSQLDTTITSGRDMYSTAFHDNFLGASNNLTLVGESNVFIKRDADNIITIKDDDSIAFKVGGSNLLNMYSDKLQINGNVEVTGVINTIDINQVELQIMDKNIVLAYDSNVGPLVDGPTTNSGSGLMIAGQAGASNSRSLIWNYNQTGITDLGTETGLQDESEWVLQGGKFVMEHDSLKFGFRVNTVTRELELVKKDGVGNYVRIARFGRTL